MIDLPTLYPHQEDLRDRVRTALQKHRRVILTAPPGVGKTRMAKWILGASANREPGTDQSGHSLFAVQRRGLVDNASSSLNEEPRLRHGVIMSGVKAAYGANVQVASIDTLLSWFVEGGQYDTSITFDLIVYDETHAHLSKLARFLQHHDAYRKQIGKHPAYVIGLTATPEAKGLADVYREIVLGPPTQWLIDNGFLAPFRYFRATQGRLGLLVRKGQEFTEDSVSKAMEGLSGALVRDWNRFAAGRPTVGFFPRRQHAQEAREVLEEAGLRVAYVDGDTDDDTRKRFFRELNTGKLDYLCNVQVVERGTDIPKIGCVQLCTSIGSLSRYRQMIGRGSRIHPEKTDCVARGTMILTHRGEVPIEKVRDDDRLWDGLSFVPHGGTVCKGIQDVITYCGLTATPSHIVKTSQGWRTFGDCAREQIPIIRTGIGGSAIRECRDHLPEHRVARTFKVEAVPFCKSALRHLFAGVVHLLGQPTRRTHKGMPVLQSAEAVSVVALFSGAVARTEMHQPKGTRIRTLRRSRSTLQLPVGIGSLPVDQGAPGDSQGHATGPYRQRRPLRAGKPEVVHATAKPGAHSEGDEVGGFASVPSTVPGGSVRRRDVEATYPAGNDVRGDRRSLSQSGLQKTKREVWDILNAGPLHRFTAQGLLVHNCCILDHGGNVARHGFFEDDPLWSLDRSTKDAGEVKARPVIECPKCEAIYRGGKCRNCGYEPTKEERKVQGLEFDGTQLVEVTKKDRAPQRIMSAEEIMVKAMYSAGRSGRTWKQAVGMFLAMSKKQGTNYRVPKRVSVGSHTYRMLSYGDLNSGRKVAELFPFTKERGNHGGQFME